MTSEFERIAAFQALFGQGGAATVALGNGDDGAVLNVDGQLVVTTDALVEGVDFGPRVPWEAVGHKAVHVNASDLAAMGARPLAFVWSLCAPQDFAGWDGLGRGASAAAHALGLPCVGGDLSRTSGPLVVSVTALGCVPAGQALTRAGARPGDTLYVSGALGGAAAGLRWLMDHPQARADSVGQLLQDVPETLRAAVAAQVTPQAQLALGQALRGWATACVDVSDGLVQDLCHLLVQSGVGATLDVAALPRFEVLQQYPQADAQHMTLAGGEDFQLLWTAPPTVVGALQGDPGRWTAIGTITAQAGLSLGDLHVPQDDVERLHRGVAPQLPAARNLLGWRHF